MNTTPQSTVTIFDPRGRLADDATVVIIGASGKTGRRVAAGLERLGVEVRRASPSGTTSFVWEDEGTWDAALEGSSAAYITYYPDLAVPGAADVIARLAERARSHGLDRAVLLSGRGEPGAQQAEQALLAELPRSSVVRCAWFLQNFSEGLLRDAVLHGTITLPAPGTAVEPFLDLDDLAAVAVHALTAAGGEGGVHELTGPDAVSLDEAAAILSGATGRRVDYVPGTVARFAEQLGHLGMPHDDAVWLGELFEGLLDGRNVVPAAGVERMLGRPATSFADWATRAAAEGAWA